MAGHGVAPYPSELLAGFSGSEMGASAPVWLSGPDRRSMPFLWRHPGMRRPRHWRHRGGLATESGSLRNCGSGVCPRSRAELRGPLREEPGRPRDLVRGVEHRIWPSGLALVLADTDLRLSMTPVLKLGFCPPIDRPRAFAEAQPKRTHGVGLLAAVTPCFRTINRPAPRYS